MLYLEFREPFAFTASCPDSGYGWDECLIEINETDVGLFHVEDRSDAFKFAVFVELWDREDWINPGCGSMFARVV